MPKKDIKALLGHYSVVVNGKVQTKFDYKLKNGDIVLIDFNNRYFFLQKYRIKIIYEDSELLVINKSSGLLSVSAELKNKNQTNALEIMNSYVKLSTDIIDNKNSNIYTVHRLDKDTSGVLIFSKSREFKELLQENWNGIVSERFYYAVVEGVFEKKYDTLTSYLTQDKNGMVYSVNNYNIEKNNNAVKPLKIEKAVTQYNVIKENESFSLLDVSISTGKKNQIRVALRDTKHPVIGDKKYGSSVDPIKRLGLHAYCLTLKHPLSGEIMSFEAKMPKEFNRLFLNRK